MMRASTPAADIVARTADQRRCSSPPDTALNARVGVPALVVDDIGQAVTPAGEKQAQVVPHQRIGWYEVIVAHPADKRRDDDAILAPQRVIGRQRLLAE